MSNEEARQQKAMALLQYQEALEAFNALREEIEGLAKRLSTISIFANDLSHQNMFYIKGVAEQRKKIEAEEPAFRAAMDFDALIALDDKLIAAQQRLNDANEVKKTFGIKP